MPLLEARTHTAKAVVKYWGTVMYVGSPGRKVTLSTGKAQLPLGYPNFQLS